MTSTVAHQPAENQGHSLGALARRKFAPRVSYIEVPCSVCGSLEKVHPVHEHDGHFRCSTCFTCGSTHTQFDPRCRSCWLAVKRAMSAAGLQLRVAIETGIEGSDGNGKTNAQ